MEQQIKNAGDNRQVNSVGSSSCTDTCKACAELAYGDSVAGQVNKESPLKLPTKEELGKATDAIASRLLKEQKFSDMGIEEKLLYLEKRHRYLQEQQQLLMASLAILENHFHSPTGEVAVSLGELRFRMRQQRESKN